MKLKSLLIGSAAAMAVSTGVAKAADPIVMAEPEPMEYVRICDVYGAGFFYIPGTETCLKIGGYYRLELQFGNFTGYRTFARFAPTFDTRSETEWGTLRGFAEVEFSWASPNPVGANPGAYATGTNLNHAFIELIGGSGTFRIGKGDLPWARFLGYGASGFSNGGAYAFNAIYGNAFEASYTFVGSNGFSGIVAVIDNPVNNTWASNFEAGVNWAQGWGSIGAIAGYDGVTNTWGAKGVVRFNAPNGAFQAGVMAFYTSGAGSYQVSALQTNWSALAYARFQATQTVNFGVWAQWFDTNTWAFRGNINWTPVENLLIRPEVGYTQAAGGGAGTWDGVIRIQRSIP